MVPRVYQEKLAGYAPGNRNSSSHIHVMRAYFFDKSADSLLFSARKMTIKRLTTV